VSSSDPEAVERLVTLNRAHAAHQLLSGIAHDLRNDLQVISLGGGTAAGAVGGESDAVDRMTETLACLSELVRPAGDDRVDADVEEALHLVVRLAGYRRHPPVPPIRLVGPPRPVTAMIQPWALRQILLNLVLNAQDASGDSGAAIDIAARVGDTGVEITVEDAGSGPVALPGRPFATSRPGQTHGGLGLYVAGVLARRYGGSLGLTGRAAGGTRAALVLPVRP
jgi:two-component system C4-dicarboxylate transport sensor histidine kinase DctB